ncbi:MAG: phosphoribosyl-ATP diphosphatase [Spirochaetaceae bacterium]|nr:phosphoribosyl-ATP diphosphatase [Spirochaetaceae bacterium]
MISKETPLPLLIQVKKGPSRAALMSPKGFNKSLEQGILWLNTPGNNRILPMPGDMPFLSLDMDQGFYRALFPSDTALPPMEMAFHHVDLEDHSESLQAEKTDDAGILSSLESTIIQRKKDMPQGSYTTLLFSKGMAKIKKKTGEEAIELLLAETPQDYIFESADLIYHMMVLWQQAGISLADVQAELKRREE